jgi:hypothetical protein
MADNDIPRLADVIEQEDSWAEKVRQTLREACQERCHFCRADGARLVVTGLSPMGGPLVLSFGCVECAVEWLLRHPGGEAMVGHSMCAKCVGELRRQLGARF